MDESNSSLTLSRLLSARVTQQGSNGPGSLGDTLGSTLGGTLGPNGRLKSVSELYNSSASLAESEAVVGALCAEMNALMHDYQVVSRIAGLADTLRGRYPVRLHLI